MPLEVRRLSASIIFVLLSIVGISAQSQPPSSVTQTNTLPTSADVMRARVSKAKAFVAVKNYAAAIYELEGIRREINEPSVNGVVQVMLMNCYLEQLDYKRAQAFLTEIFNAQKANKPNTNYFAIAGQVVKSAKNQLERYRSLGLSVADRNLPTEAAADVNKMRETVEMVVTQSKTLGVEKKLTADSMALLEEATVARGNLARDDYDAKRWKEEVADARETLANSRSKVINAVDDGNLNPIQNNNSVASNQKSPVIPPTVETTTTSNPINSVNTANKTVIEVPKTEPPAPPVVKMEEVANKTTETTPNSNNQTAQIPVKRERVIEKQEPPKVEETLVKVEDVKAETQAIRDASPLQMGSLLEYATEKVNPTYPPAARTVRMTGVVKINLLVDEEGRIEVQNTSGPQMLQRAAIDAVKKWKFRPFMRDGQPVKATGYVSFNFNL